MARRRPKTARNRKTKKSTPKKKKTVKSKPKKPSKRKAVKRAGNRKTVKKAGKKKKTAKNVAKKKSVQKRKTVKKTAKRARKKTGNKTEPKKTKTVSKENKVESSNLIEKRSLKEIKMKRHPVEISLKIIIALSFLGLIVAGYLIYLHYKPEAATICTISEKLNCDVVNKSAYAEFMGIPNSIIGALGYLYFIIVSLITLKGYDLSKVKRGLKPKHLNFMVVLFSIFGWLFSMYLLYIETFVLHAYCIFCLTSLGIITVIMMTAIYSYRQCMRCGDIIRRIHLKACGKMCRYCQ